MKEESKREENSKGVVDSDNIEKHLFHFRN